jgi:hypothetical protein
VLAVLGPHTGAVVGDGLAPTVAEILAEHVTLEVEGIDRMYLNAYVPPLQHEKGVVYFFVLHRAAKVASSALMDPNAQVRRGHRGTGSTP